MSKREREVCVCGGGLQNTHTRARADTHVAKLERVEQHIEQHLRTSVLRGRADSRSNKRAREREAEKNKAGR